MKIANTKKNREILEYIFQNAPKTYEEALLQGKVEPILIGKKYNDYKKEEIKINNLFEKHINNQCECNINQKCMFQKYVLKEISRDFLLKNVGK